MTGKTFGKHNYERGTYHFKIHDRNYKLHWEIFHLHSFQSVSVAVILL